MQNPKVNRKETSRVRIGRIAFTEEASKKEIEEGELSNPFQNLSKEQNTEFICPQRRKEFWQTESKPSLCIQSTLEECVVKVVKENGEENCSQKTTYSSKRPEVTLRDI